MGNVLREYVESLSDDVRATILEDNDSFERDGFIGDSVLRYHTETFMRLHSMHESTTATWLNFLVGECYRCFAMKYIAESRAKMSYDDAVKVHIRELYDAFPEF